MLNILQNFAIYLFHYFLSYIIVIPKLGFHYGLSWDNLRQILSDIFLLTFPSEIIWSLKIINIQQLSKKEKRQFAWKSCFFTFVKVQKAEQPQIPKNSDKSFYRNFYEFAVSKSQKREKYKLFLITSARNINNNSY